MAQGSRSDERYRFDTIFYNIDQRCKNKNSKSYLRYGGRGIKNTWRSLGEFRKDMWEPYMEHVSRFGLKNTTIDRIDNNGDYSAANCRWATYKGQMRNNSHNRLLTVHGVTKTAVEWCEEYGITTQTLSSRMNKYGMDAEQALTWKRHERRGTTSYATIDGISLSVMEWSKRLDVPYNTLHARIKRGMTPEQAVYKSLAHPA